MKHQLFVVRPWGGFVGAKTNGVFTRQEIVRAYRVIRGGYCSAYTGGKPSGRMLLSTLRHLRRGEEPKYWGC